MEGYILEVGPQITVKPQRIYNIFIRKIMSTYFKPIWKDTKIEASRDLSPMTYTITCNGQDIFHGKAYVRPGSENIEININKICQNYISNPLPINGNDFHYGLQEAPTACQSFGVSDEDLEFQHTFYFLYDWSYEGPDFSEDINMSRPINGKYVSNMMFPATYWKYNDKKVYNMIAQVPEDCTFDDEPLYDIPTCGDWVLYYLNRFGGWDAFVIEGKVVRKDTYKRNTFAKAIDNSTIEHESQDYTNQITVGYTLNTGWLSDEESSNLAFNMLNTNKAYLHDIQHNKIMPVRITNASTEYKTFKNTKKLVSYSITVEASQIQENYA